MSTQETENQIGGHNMPLVIKEVTKCNHLASVTILTKAEIDMLFARIERKPWWRRIFSRRGA
jgi:hypothetical protein